MLDGRLSMRVVLVSLMCWSSLAWAAREKGAPTGKRAAEEQAARGDAWTIAGRCDEAVKAYQRALELDAKNALVKVRLAHCQSKVAGGAEAARKTLEEVAALPPPAGTAALEELGDLAVAAGDFKTAVSAYDRLVAKSPSSIEAKVALLDALKGLADAGDAAARTRALELAGKLKSDARADQAAQRHAEETEGLLKYGDAGKDLLDGRARLAMGDAKGAAAALERVVAAHADLEEAEYLLGLAYAAPGVGRKEDARKAWRKAPHQKEAQLALGVDAYEGGDLDEAEKRLAGAAALDENYQAAHYQLGLVYRERGAIDLAKKSWQKAVAIDSKSELGKWAATKLQLATGNINALAEGQVIDPSSEIGIGQAIAKQVEDKFGRIDDPKLEDRLNGILRKLASVSDRPEREMRYRVVLVDVPMINALTLPGGTVLVFRGLVDLVRDKMGDTDDAWASVLGHECAHAALRHGMGMIQVASSLSPKAFEGGAGDLAGLLNTVSRAHEFEADQFGALYAYRAGYNPAESLTLHATMLAAMGEIPRGMTHPTHAERIARVRDYLLDLRAKTHGFDLAVKALAGGDYDSAIGHFEVFLGVFPDSTGARSNLGVALHRKALTALEPSTRFRRVTDVDPNSRARKIELRSADVNVGGLKAAPKIDERLLREAVGEYEAALSIDPSYTKAQVNLGAALDDLKDRKGARAALEKAVRMAPQSKEAWNNLGAVAAETGDTDRALTAFKKALELDGGYAEAWFNLAMTYEQAAKEKD
ncbi:MAG TPA: tetratricopeptide repeat protein, partial [Polyangia bacterium]|nr:tetratricopeptide repeat protein [Polyangia bacterium]